MSGPAPPHVGSGSSDRWIDLKSPYRSTTLFSSHGNWCGAMPRGSFRRMAQTLRIIKKYPNRRLYDTEISSYITLEEVRQLVIDGEEFEVRDAKSGDDLTRSVLLQIIAEHEETGQPMFTTQLLSQIIRFYGDSMQGFMGSYLEKSLQIFLDQQQKFRSQLNNILGQTPWSMLNGLTERNLEVWKSVQEGFLNAAANSAKNTGNKEPKS